MADHLKNPGKFSKYVLHPDNLLEDEEEDELVVRQYPLILHYRIPKSLADDESASLDLLGEIIDALKERCAGAIDSESPLRQVDDIILAHDLSELI